MKTRAIIQSRMLSTQLRGKPLMAVAGTPLLYRVVESIKKLSFVDEIMIATTKAPADDPIAAAANNLGVLIYRGDSVNVLKRFRDASADLEEEDTIVRFTSDNPLCKLATTQKLFEIHINGNNDYTHIESLTPVVPEFIKVRALREIASMVDSDFDKEHVTPYLRKNKDIFKVKTLPSDYDGLSNSLERYLTIDSHEDLKRFEALLEELENRKKFSYNDIHKWLKNYLNIHAESEKTVKLGNVTVGDQMPTFIIAEVGQNHNGDMEIAKKLINMAIRCGADAVKFQKRDIPSELTEEAHNRIYDSPNSFGHTYGEHRIYLELDENQHKELKEYANAQGITYFCTPCDIPSVEMMERINVPFYKVASRDLTNLPTLKAIAETGKPVIISTGMASMEEIEDAINVLGKDRNDIIILQCISQYPAELDKVNLKAMKSIRSKFNKLVGFSDHTTGIIASVTASILGASVIEKHITLSRAMKGSDHAGSLEENGLRLMVKYIREAAKTIGDGIKMPDPATKSAKIKLARSITSKKPIPKGITITEDMLCLKSPGNGLKWKEKNKLIGKKAAIDIPVDQTIFLKYISDFNNG